MHGAGILMADTHHDATHGNQRSRCKTELLRTEDGCDGNITAAHQLTVGLDSDLVTKSVLHQCLVCFRKTEFPGKSGVVNGT